MNLPYEIQGKINLLDKITRAYAGYIEWSEKAKEDCYCHMDVPERCPSCMKRHRYWTTLQRHLNDAIR